MGSWSGPKAWTVVALLATGCGVEPHEESESIGSTSQEIRFGTPLDSTRDHLGVPHMSHASGSCSSVLLRKNWVATAKHCDPTTSRFTLNGVARNSLRVFEHPTLDVALHQLDGSLAASTSVSTPGPFPLYPGTGTSLLNQQLYCVGWGAYDCTDTLTCTGAGILRAAWLTPTTVQGANLESLTFPLNVNGQQVLFGDSGGACLTAPANLQKRTHTGVIRSGGFLTHSTVTAADNFRAWADGIIGSAPSTGNLSGYVRTDLASSVVYRSGGGTGSSIRELSKGDGSWSVRTLGGGAAGPPSPFTYSDGYNSVLYRSTNNHIYELYMLPGGSWRGPADIHSVVSANDAAGNPAGFVQADRTNSVVYRNTSQRLTLLTYPPRGTAWSAQGLILAPNVAVGDPVGYVRADGVSAVVYLGTGGAIMETSRKITDVPWGWSSPRNLTEACNPDAPAATGKPRPFSRSDGHSAVVFRTSSGQIYQLTARNDSSTPSWSWSNLTGAGPTAISDPIGYVRGDGVSAIVYLGSDARVRELAHVNNVWVNTNLTQASGASAPDTGNSYFWPNPYVRADRTSAVVFAGTDGHIWEITRAFGGSSWGKTNMTQEAGL